jgi:hypothetical protein
MRKEKLFGFVFVTLFLALSQSMFGSVDTRLVFVSNTYDTPIAGQGTLVLDVQAISSGSSEAINIFQDAFQLDATLRAQYVSIGFSSELFPPAGYTTTEDYAASTGRVRYVYTYNSGSRGTIGTSYTQVVRISIYYTMTASTTTLTWYTGIPNYSVTNSGDVDITGSEEAIPSELTTVALPIQLASSAANVVRGSDVEVGWKTVSETNNYGFEVYRKRGDTGEWTKVGFVQGHGTTLAPQSYSYVDRSLSFGEYFYRIKQIDLDGKSETFPEMAVTVGAGADKFFLAQNYPNPFNPSTVIEFVVPVSGHTTLKVYNVLGQEVATLFSGNAEAGKINSARFDATSLPSGLYFYTLKNAAKTETKRMLLVK